MVAATPRRRTMRAVDAVWLAMDRPENLLVIDTLMWFDGPVDAAGVRTLLRERVLDHYPVFRSRPAEPLVPFGLPRWHEDPGLDLDRHVVEARLPAPGDDRTLREFVEARIREPLDPAHPLWRVYVLHGYRPDDRTARPEASVVLARVHHAIADGVALAHVLLSLTDPVPDPAASGAAVAAGGPLTARPAAPPQRAPDRRPDGPTGLVRLPAAAARAAAGGLHLLTDLSRLVRPGAALDALSVTWQAGRVADKVLLGSLPRTALSGTPGPAKHAVWTAPYDLARVKAAGRRSGCTVNDVLLAAVGGALAAYLREHDGRATDLTALVPVDVRGPGATLPPELGNRFALVLLPLVSDERGPADRLVETHRRMEAIKSSPEAAITFGMLGAIGLTHPEVERMLVDVLSAKAVGVLTNVVGPARPRTLTGATMTSVLGWVPQAGSQTLGVCVFSYGGAVRVGFRVDAAVVDDPERLVEGFDAALEELLALPGPPP